MMSSMGTPEKEKYVDILGRNSSPKAIGREEVELVNKLPSRKRLFGKE